MTANVLRRFIVLLAVLSVGGFVFWDVLDDFVMRAPGDYRTEKGDIHLRGGAYENALKEFNLALKEQPDHRGALMGRALVFIQTNQPQKAVDELSYLITYLNKTLTEEDRTGRGVLAAAFANRGIVHDRQGRYRQAFEDYLMALKVDDGAVEGPDLIHRVLYGNPRASSVRKRARYLHEQFQKPEGERLMRVPAIDESQRMHKP